MSKAKRSLKSLSSLIYIAVGLISWLRKLTCTFRVADTLHIPKHTHTHTEKEKGREREDEGRGEREMDEGRGETKRAENKVQREVIIYISRHTQS